MTHSILEHLIGLATAATTTLALFTSMVSLAEDDRKARATARIAPVQVAAVDRHAR